MGEFVVAVAVNLGEDFAHALLRRVFGGVDIADLVQAFEGKEEFFVGQKLIAISVLDVQVSA
jgi:hypothetical protein